MNHPMPIRKQDSTPFHFVLATSFCFPSNPLDSCMYTRRNYYLPLL